MANVSTTLTYNLSDTAGNACNVPVLERELADAGLTTIVRRDGTNIFVDFTTLVTAEQQATCTATVAAHQGLPFNDTRQSSSDPTEHAVTAGDDWVTVGEFNSGPLPEAPQYVTQWSAEAKVDTEAIGNRVEVRLMMWDVAEASNDALGLPAWQQYQAGAWLGRRAGESFNYKLQARAVGCNGTVRRIRFGLML
jgi:hypothetical protein